MEQFNIEGINILFKRMPKTPRIAVNFFFKTNKKEKFYGVNALLSRLLLQGTKKYSALELSKEFEQECIDITFKALENNHFKLRKSYDIIGTELCGSVKNIIAIASGILKGLNIWIISS